IALIAAVQFFSFIKKNHYEFLDSIVKGDFSLLIDWFSKNVYSANYGFLEQLKKVTGRDLDIECYTSYLSEKYNLSQ
ncbi:MAG TPA: carboxypeptidase, partial [Rickettsia endosymbiont of Bembidion lapponicum]|nr:carboxypeptidase [Rickettsia endosymbiont of Bembidion lapponicum]